jgi:hypothetical protein
VVLHYLELKPEAGIRIWMALPFKGFERFLHSSLKNVYQQADRVFYAKDNLFPNIQEIIDITDAIFVADIRPREEIIAYREQGKQIQCMHAAHVLAFGRLLTQDWEPEGDE